MDARMNFPAFTLLPIRRMAILLAFCLFAAMLTGCFKKSVTPGPDVARVAPRPAAPADGSPVASAEAAYAAGDVARAEQISTQLSSRPGLSAADAPRVWRILALSSQANRHPNLSLTALERWRGLQKDADITQEWQQTWTAAIGQLPPYEAKPRITAVLQDASRPWQMRMEAGVILAARQWSNGDAVSANATLLSLYSAATEKNQKIALEHRLFDELHKADAAALAKLASLSTPETEKQFPTALVRLEEARRQGQDPATAEAAQAQVAALREGNALADPGLLAGWSAPKQDVSVTPLPGRTLALVLPMGGQFGNLAAKIALGAETAGREFAAAGHPVTLVVIDTDQPDWLEKLANLPPDVTVVGGPLRAADYTAAKNRGLTNTRAFLSFLPQLSDQDEGKIAWRFFPSPEDQVQALLRLTRGLGITNYAVLMPDKDPYAERMAKVFEAQAHQTGASVVHKTTYPAESPEVWNKLVGSFLGTNKNAAKAPNVSFQAVFLPDSWKNMEGLIPNLFYYRERRQVLLGTSLWEQGLSGLKVPVDARYYSLTAFPGAWRTKSPTPAGEALQAALVRAGKGEADFWTGIGYDFVRFAATLDIQPGWTADSVNAKLSSHPGMAWSVAPISWDRNGRASQELFLFTPESDGFAPVDVEKFRQNFEKAWSGPK